MISSLWLKKERNLSGSTCLNACFLVTAYLNGQQYQDQYCGVSPIFGVCRYTVFRTHSWEQSDRSHLSGLRPHHVAKVTLQSCLWHLLPIIMIIITVLIVDDVMMMMMDAKCYLTCCVKTSLAENLSPRENPLRCISSSHGKVKFDKLLKMKSIWTRYALDADKLEIQIWRNYDELTESKFPNHVRVYVHV